MADAAATSSNRAGGSRLTRTSIVLLTAVAAGAVVLAGLTRSRVPEPMNTRIEVAARPVAVEISPDDDVGKQGRLRSVMAQVNMRQEPRTTGISPDTLRFQFGAPVRVVGVLVSVDIRHLDLVEVAVGINQPVAYGLDARDWLIHASDASGSTGSKIDEHIWFPGSGFALGPEDYVGVGGWLWNGDSVERSVSPEVILYYEWVD